MDCFFFTFGPIRPQIVPPHEVLISMLSQVFHSSSTDRSATMLLLARSFNWLSNSDKQTISQAFVTNPKHPFREGLNLQALSIRASPNRNSSGPFPPVSFIHGNVLRIRSGFLFQLFRFNWGRDQRRKIIRRRRFLPQINPKFTFQLGDATQESGVPITLNHHKTTIIKRGPFIKQLKIILWGFRKSLFSTSGSLLLTFLFIKLNCRELGSLQKTHHIICIPVSWGRTQNPRLTTFGHNFAFLRHGTNPKLSPPSSYTMLNGQLCDSSGIRTILFEGVLFNPADKGLNTNRGTIPD